MDLSSELGKIQEGETYEKIYEEKQVVWEIRKSCYFGMWDWHSPAFSFADNTFYFILSSTYTNSSDYISLFVSVSQEKGYECSVEFNYGVKTRDGTVKHLRREILSLDKMLYGPFLLMKRSELQKELTEPGTSDVFTLRFTLKIETLLSRQLNELDGLKGKKLKNLNGLSQNFKDLFADEGSCDTTLRVKDKQFKVHRVVLMARSSVFSAMFRSDMSEKQTGIITIPDCDADSFQEFLEYLYCGQLENISFSSVYHLYSTSDKYDVQDLKAICVEYLKQSLTVENLYEVVIMADKHDDTRLFSAAQDFFNRNIGKIFYSAGWNCLIQYNFPLGNKLLKGMASKVKV